MKRFLLLSLFFSFTLPATSLIQAQEPIPFEADGALPPPPETMRQPPPDQATQIKHMRQMNPKKIRGQKSPLPHAKQGMSDSERAEMKALIEKAKNGDEEAKKILTDKINKNFERRTQETEKRIQKQEEQLEKTKNRLKEIQKNQPKRTDEILKKMLKK